VVTKLKGFKDYIYIYSSRLILHPVLELYHTSILSEIKTHTFNIPYYNPPNEPCEVIPDKEDKIGEHKTISKKISAIYDLRQIKEDSTTIIGRDNLINDCFEGINNSLKGNTSSYVLVKGIYGSGKSLFIRCVMKKIIESNSVLTKNNKFKHVFNSFQLPNTLYDPLNGFRKIMSEIYEILIKELSCKKKVFLFK
jgi:hypothetical protein